MQISEYISLLSLFVAVFAALAIPFGIYIEKQNRELALAQHRLEAGLQQIILQNGSFRETVQAVGAIAKQSSARDQFLSAVVNSLLLSSALHSDRSPNFLNAIARFDGGISEAVNDLLLFSSHEDERLSAFRAAANQYRTLRSLKKMELSLQLYSDTRPEISACVNELTKRLNSMNGATSA